MEGSNRYGIYLIMLIIGSTLVGLIVGSHRTACELTLWIALAEAPLYEIDDDGKASGSRAIFQGDVCSPGRKVMEKDFLYVEVLCRDAGYGWIVDSYLFEKSTKADYLGQAGFNQ